MINTSNMVMAMHAMVRNVMVKTSMVSLCTITDLTHALRMFTIGL